MFVRVCGRAVRVGAAVLCDDDVLCGCVCVCTMCVDQVLKEDKSDGSAVVPKARENAAFVNVRVPRTEL